MHSVTLYHWEPNANSGKPMLALMEKGVPVQQPLPRPAQFRPASAGVPGDQSAGDDPGDAARAARAHRVDRDHGIRRRGVPRSAADAERCARPVAGALVDEVHGPMARPELLHDRLERVRRTGGALQGPGGTQGRHRAHSATGAPRRLAQGNLRAVQRRGNAGIPAPRGAGHPHARAGSSRSGRGWPAINTVWPTSTASIWHLRCRCHSRRCPTTNSRPTYCAGCARSTHVPATKACWAMGRTDMAKRVTILEQPHIGRSTPA